jgi:hypothetical protein
MCHKIRRTFSTTTHFIHVKFYFPDHNSRSYMIRVKYDFHDWCQSCQIRFSWPRRHMPFMSNRCCWRLLRLTFSSRKESFIDRMWLTSVCVYYQFAECIVSDRVVGRCRWCYMLVVARSFVCKLLDGSVDATCSWGKNEEALTCILNGRK